MSPDPSGFEGLYEVHPTHGVKDLHEDLLKGLKEFLAGLPELRSVFDTLSAVMKDYDVVYLPTYRRIELALNLDEASSRSSRPPWERSASPKSLIPKEMNFGLSDISRRLREIFLEIQQKSNSTYQAISANIINELMDGSFENHDGSVAKPDKEDLRLFFERIEGSPIRNRLRSKIPDLEKIYNDDFPDKVRPFLIHFLGKLKEAIESTKPLENRANGFVTACNKYLSDADQTAFVDGNKGSIVEDHKKIKIDQAHFRPSFTNGTGTNGIGIEALSSGEKQVVSLFSRLYLYDKKKIILFDEPELSLSIGWQQQLLPDVCESPDFEQIIAITHSPFIFDNALDAYAQNLKVTLSRTAEICFEDPAGDTLDF